MGQQQFLLVFLGIVIAAVSISVGYSLYEDHLITVNRNEVLRDLALIAVKAQKYYYLPSNMNGGSRSFAGLTADAAGLRKLVSQEFSNNEHGTYSIHTAGDESLMILQGVGKVQLSDGSYPVYYCRVRARKYLMQKIN